MQKKFLYAGVIIAASFFLAGCKLLPEPVNYDNTSSEENMMQEENTESADEMMQEGDETMVKDEDSAMKEDDKMMKDESTQDSAMEDDAMMEK